LGTLLPLGCGGSSTSSGAIDASQTTGDGSTNTLPDGGTSPTADANPFGPVNDAGQPLCDNKGTLAVCQCSDDKDNETTPDGKIDALDPECSGPFDNDESTFATGIPGDNSDPFVQDCFFDGDSGGGNDKCRWDIRCLDFEAPYEGPHCNGQRLEGCVHCRQLTPNGCDCFGCCDIYVGDKTYTVRIQDTCTTEAVENPDLCPPCTKVVDCSNPCDPCEYCIGHEPEPSCTDADGGITGPCAEGVVECDIDGACPADFGCVSGCCVPLIQ
jgi:hypothetical protein